MKLYRYQVGLYEYQTKNSIGKPYEGIENHERLIEDNNTRIKLHVRFDEGGADSLLIIVILVSIIKVGYQALLYVVMSRIII